MKPAIGVATTTIPSINPNNVIFAAFLEMVGWSGIAVSRGWEDGSGEALGSGDDVGDGPGEDTGSEIELDVCDEFPTVMFLTVLLLTVKLYS